MSRTAGVRETAEQAEVDESDAGRAMIEVVFLAVLVLIPVIYILISLVRVQAATLAVGQAARDAGRAMDAAPSVGEGVARAQEIARISLRDQNISADRMTLRFVAPGTGCSVANAVAPSLDAGAVYDICVTAVLSLPGVPSVLTGSRNTATGVYTLHVGELREGG